MSHPASSKFVVLGVTGSIAAHRAIEVASALTQSNVQVQVVMTRDALRFVTDLPFKTLSRRRVITDLYDEEEGWKPAHIDAADRADLFLVAPATANFIAKYTHGIADNALTCLALALEPGVPVLLAPAMNGKMWLHPATQANVEVLTRRGVRFIGPERGLLSCGYEGIGRLCPVDTLVQEVLRELEGGKTQVT